MFNHRVLDLQVSANITAEEIDSLLKQIYDLNGCPRCGLGGYDLSIRVLPAELEIARLNELKRFDNVLNVDVRGMSHF
jgi:hypothetical protein